MKILLPPKKRKKRKEKKKKKKKNLSETSLCVALVNLHIRKDSRTLYNLHLFSVCKWEKKIALQIEPG